MNKRLKNKYIVATLLGKLTRVFLNALFIAVVTRLVFYFTM